MIHQKISKNLCNNQIVTDVAWKIKKVMESRIRFHLIWMQLIDNKLVYE